MNPETLDLLCKFDPGHFRKEVQGYLWYPRSGTLNIGIMVSKLDEVGMGQVYWWMLSKMASNHCTVATLGPKALKVAVTDAYLAYLKRPLF